MPGIPTLRLVGALPHSILNSTAPAPSAALKYGFEGGMFMRACGAWHLFMTEMAGDPHWVNTTVAHWRMDPQPASGTGPGSGTWRRMGTLAKGSGNTNGTDERSHVDAPMVVMNVTTGHWEMFYVAYWHGVPGCNLSSCNGSIWRSVSAEPGCAGLNGPFVDVGKVMQMDSHAQPWEGDQGDDSVSPPTLAPAPAVASALDPVAAAAAGAEPAAASTWVAFYGSSTAAAPPLTAAAQRRWSVGLMTAPSLAGPWQRVETGNPVLHPTAENPVVTTLPEWATFDGWRYVAVFDSLGQGEQNGTIGVTFSKDMMHWSEPAEMPVHMPGQASWVSTVRTPQGIAWDDRDEGRGAPTMWLLYTAFESPGPPGLKYGWGAVGVAQVQVVPPVEH